MRWFFRIVLTLAFACLVLLAVLPHAESIKQTWLDVQATWQQVRAENGQGQTDAAPSDEATEPARNRTVLPPPEVIDEPTVNSVSIDPFIAEARERAATDPQAAMDWLQSEATGSDRLRGMLEIVAIWAAEDSETALLWLESNAQGLARHETIHSGMELWSQQDPTAAATWIEGMANDGSKSTAAQTLAENWARTNPSAAAAWVEQLPPGPIRNDAAGAYVASLMAQNQLAAADWAIRESTLQGNRELFDESIALFTAENPTAAANFIHTIENTDTAQKAMAVHIESMAAQDPATAAALIASFEGVDRRYTTELNTILLRQWSESDSVAASEWLGNANNGPARDAAIIGFAETMIDYEPEAVAAWSNSISDPQTRVNWLTHAIQTWARTNPVETLRWLKESELDPDLRSQLAREVGAD